MGKRRISVEDRLKPYELLVYRNLRRMGLSVRDAYATILRNRRPMTGKLKS